MGYDEGQLIRRATPSGLFPTERFLVRVEIGSMYQPCIIRRLLVLGIIFGCTVRGGYSENVISPFAL